MKNQHVIKEVKNGNDQVLTQIYKEYRNNFIHFAVNRYKIDTEDAKDIFADVIIELRSNILKGKLNNLTSSLKTYIFAIGKNQVFNFIRNKSRSVPLNEEVKQKTAPDTPVALLENAERSALLHDLLKQLSASCFKLLKLFYIEQLPVTEIAAIMNYSGSDSVYTQKYKCFNKLKAFVTARFNKDDFNL